MQNSFKRFLKQHVHFYRTVDNYMRYEDQRCIWCPKTRKKYRSL